MWKNIKGWEEYYSINENGDVITVTYLIHDGELGNLDVNQETYFVFNNNLNDISGETVDGNTIFNVSFASYDAVISGSNSESKEQVRQNIGLNSRSLVLASPENYKNFINGKCRFDIYVIFISGRYH